MSSGTVSRTGEGPRRAGVLNVMTASTRALPGCHCTTRGPCGTHRVAMRQAAEQSRGSPSRDGLGHFPLVVDKQRKHWRRPSSPAVRRGLDPLPDVPPIRRRNDGPSSHPVTSPPNPPPVRLPLTRDGKPSTPHHTTHQPSQRRLQPHISNPSRAVLNRNSGASGDTKVAPPRHRRNELCDNGLFLCARGTNLGANPEIRHLCRRGLQWQEGFALRLRATA